MEDKELKTFNIWGNFQVQVDFDIEARNETEARMKAQGMITDQYSLDAIGGLHIAQSTDFNLYIDEEDEPEEGD